ncbi:hypothetical protein V8C42DRAFT_331386 [Trichoderma barbatum]
MKLCNIVTTYALGFAAAAVMAAPELSKRQNDVSKCEDGTGGPRNGWLNERDCRMDCYLKEQADGDNKNNICKGMCANSGNIVQRFVCRNRWIKG